MAKEAAPAVNAAKLKALELAVAQIEKDFGKGSIMRLGDSAKMDVEALSTGVLSLDMALGIGGIPRGRVIEIYGPESSGKTTLTLSTIAATQQTGGTCAFIDAEHAFDPVYARLMGIDLDNLLVAQPDTGEQALEITETLVRSNAVDLIVVDSVAALVPRAELEGNMGDAQMGLQARLMSQALRKLTAAISKSKTCVIFINQIRMKIGVMFGNPETTTGGNALKFYSSVRIDVRKTGTITNQQEIIGIKCRAKVVKNKIAAPFKEAHFEITGKEGISKVGNVIDCAVDANIIQKAGSWFSYADKKLGQGKESVKDVLVQDPKLFAEIDKAVREKFLAGGVVVPQGSSSSDE
jgi:recombination protein RecA